MMISALCWIPKGASKFFPGVVELPSKEEIEEMIKSRANVINSSGKDEAEEDEAEEMPIDTFENAEEVKRALDTAQALSSPGKAQDIADALRKLDMDNYDGDNGFNLFGPRIGNSYYSSNALDPYLTAKDDEDEEEFQDMVIGPTDSLIVCAHTEKLEIVVFEESSDGRPNMYVHHEVFLPAFPLCLAWFDCGVGNSDKGNFISVGYVEEPAIEIWNLDILDEAEPFSTLGGIAKTKTTGHKSLSKYKKDSHKDSVLGLAWNKQIRNVLASASADKSVKIWDVVTGQCALTVKRHTKEVQTVAWNQYLPETLLSGSFDQSVIMMDMRSDDHVVHSWSVQADVESLAWDPHSNHSFVVSLDNGIVQGFDIRVAASDSKSDPKPLFILHAHDKAVCSVSYNLSVPNLLATGSVDEMVKLWDISNDQPSCIASKNFKAGKIFSVSFSNDCPFLLAIGGLSNQLQVWDTLTDVGVAEKIRKLNHHETTKA